MRKFLLAILVVFVLSLGISMAQDTTCFGLGEADCALLTEANAAMAGVTSGTFDFSLSVTAEGQNMEALSGSGKFNGDALPTVDATALANTADPAAVLSALTPVIPALNAELNLNVQGMLTVNLLLVDGVGYLNFESLAPLLGGAEALTQMGLPTSWAGLDLVDTITNLGPMLGDMSGDMGAAAEPADEEAMLAISNAALNYITVTAEAGDGVTNFIYDIDLAGLLNDPAIRGLVEQQVAAQGTSMEEFEAGLAELEGAIVNAVITVDTNSRLITTLAVNFSATIEGQPGEFAFVVNLSDLNNTAPVTAPAGAPVAKYMDLMMLLGGTMGAQ